MNYQEKQIKTNKEEPFANCKLGRSKYAKILESVVTETSGGCVIALNGEWGTGKTTFVKMWQQQLLNDGFKTLYFNAWETDFISDPLIGLIGELYKSIEGNKKNKFDNILKYGKEILSNSAPVIAKSLIKKYLGEDITNIATDIYKEMLTSIFTNEIEQYEEECKCFNDFRDALSILANELDPEHPLVFIVDELDRCNPHYAVKVLERIKHLFCVPHIVFVLCIDKEQLSNSICGYYGSDSINSTEYLRRFIDIDYYLPKPDYYSYFDYLYTQLEFDSFFKTCGGNSIEILKKSFVCLGKWLFKANNLTLRQMFKLLIYVRLACQTYKNIGYASTLAIFFLIYLRQYNNEIYDKIKFFKYDNIQSLVDELEKILSNVFLLPEYEKQYNINYYVNYTILAILLLYSEDRKYDERFKLLEQGKDRKKLLTFRLKHNNDEENLIQEIEDLSYYLSMSSLEDTINHIELLSELQNITTTSNE